MGTVRLLAVLIGAAAASGCGAYSTCGVTKEDSKREDGGVFRCARPEDCPRTANTFACTTDDEFPESECVSCTASTCLRHIPVKCK